MQAEDVILDNEFETVATLPPRAMRSPPLKDVIQVHLTCSDKSPNQAAASPLFTPPHKEYFDLSPAFKLTPMPQRHCGISPPSMSRTEPAASPLRVTPPARRLQRRSCDGQIPCWRSVRNPSQPRLGAKDELVQRFLRDSACNGPRKKFLEALAESLPGVYSAEGEVHAFVPSIRSVPACDFHAEVYSEADEDFYDFGEVSSLGGTPARQGMNACPSQISSEDENENPPFRLPPWLASAVDTGFYDGKEPFSRPSSSSGFSDVSTP